VTHQNYEAVQCPNIYSVEAEIPKISQQISCLLAYDTDLRLEMAKLFSLQQSWAKKLGRNLATSTMTNLTAS